MPGRRARFEAGHTWNTSLKSPTARWTRASISSTTSRPKEKRDGQTGGEREHHTWTRPGRETGEGHLPVQAGLCGDGALIVDGEEVAPDRSGAADLRDPHGQDELRNAVPCEVIVQDVVDGQSAPVPDVVGRRLDVGAQRRVGLYRDSRSPSDCRDHQIASSSAVG